MWIPLLGLPFGVLVGVLFVPYSGHWSTGVWLVLFTILTGWLQSQNRGRNRTGRKLVWLCLILACGSQWGSFQRSAYLPWAPEEGRYLISGKVVDVPSRQRFGQRIRLAITCFGTTADPCGQYRKTIWKPRVYALVSLPGSHPDSLQAPPPGTVVQMPVDFKVRKSEHNPGEFDPTRWLLSNHIVIQLRLSEHAKAEALSSHFSIDQLRLKIGDYLANDQGDGNSSHQPQAVLLALVTGDRSLMSDAHWNLFNRTGTTHLVAISGLHIGLVATLVFLVFKAVFRRWIWFSSRYPAQNGGWLLAWAAALLYAAVAGFSLPTQRAMIMLTVFVLLRLLGRSQSLWVALAWAFCLVLLWDPVACLSLGFWLSFVAVALILWAIGGAVLSRNRWWGWSRVQWGLLAGLTPVLLWAVHSASLISLLTNVLAIPLIGFIVVPLALVWAGLWSLIGDQADGLLEGLLWGLDLFIVALDWSSNWQWGVWSVSARSITALALAMVGVLWLATAGLPGRVWGGVLLLPILISRPDDSGVYLLRSTDLKMAVHLPDKVLFLAPAYWPRLLPEWQTRMLDEWGIQMPAGNVPMQDTAALWQSDGLVLAEYRLNNLGLGQRRVETVRFMNICELNERTKLDQQVQILIWRGSELGRCGVQWVLPGQSGFYWPTQSTALQKRLSGMTAGSFPDAFPEPDYYVVYRKSGESVMLHPDAPVIHGGDVPAGSTGIRVIHDLEVSGYWFRSLVESAGQMRRPDWHLSSINR